MSSHLFCFLTWRNVNLLTSYICRRWQVLLFTPLCNSTVYLALTLHHAMQKLTASGLTRCHHCIKNKSKLLRWANSDMRGGPKVDQSPSFPGQAHEKGPRKENLPTMLVTAEDNSEEKVLWARESLVTTTWIQVSCGKILLNVQDASYLPP